jgi:hypothetical protein
MEAEGPIALAIEGEPDGAPESQVAWEARAGGSRARAGTDSLCGRAVSGRRERTNPHTSEYVRFHLAARSEARRFVAASASVPPRPSTEKTREVK